MLDAQTPWRVSTPKLLEPSRVGGRVLDRVLNVPVPEVILNEPRIRALVGQREAASVEQHVGVGKQGQGRGGAVFSQGQIDGGTVQRLPLLTNKKRLAGWLHPGAFFQPGGYGSQLVAAQGMRRR